MPALICPNCHEANTSEAEFCSSCGMSLRAEKAMREKHQENEALAARLTVEEGSIASARSRLDSDIEALTQEVRQVFLESDKKIVVPDDSDDARRLKTAIGIDPNREELTLMEAHRMEYESNCSIPYGGVQWNAAQVALLEKPCLPDQNEKFYRGYNSNYRDAMRGPLGGRVWHLLAFAAAVVLLVTLGLTVKALVAVVCATAIAFAAVRVAAINTHWDGYSSGYSDGKHAGVREALSLGPEEKADQVKRATDMQVFERNFPEYAHKWI